MAPRTATTKKNPVIVLVTILLNVSDLNLIFNKE